MCMCTDREEERKIVERGEDMLYIRVYPRIGD